MKTKNLRKENAITLVALIITIIVLLILAMVSIALVMNSGIITKSKTAVDKYSQEEIQEQLKLAYSEWQMSQYTGTPMTEQDIQAKLGQIFGAENVTDVSLANGKLTAKINGKTYEYDASTGVASKVKTVADYPTATPGKANKNENTKYTSDGKTAVIPAGYTVDATQNSIDNGLVISKDGNEWVWIPVSNVTDLYTENTTNQEWILCGTSGDSKVVSQYASKARTDVRNDLTRTTPGTTTNSFREPDTVVGNDGNSYDAVQEYRTAAGFTTLVDMATKLKDDYKNMIDSVRKNGGFYVGRYELSNAGTKKDQPSLTNTNWYNLYAKCKTFGDESTTYSRMIWGCQWDQVCKFISTAKDKNGQTISLSDSTSYGNYMNSENSPRNKINTGSNDNYKTNNIYDLAGNCYEWTQETYRTNARAYRGGNYDNNGGNTPVTGRNYGSSSDRYFGNVSSRPVLYVK